MRGPQRSAARRVAAAAEPDSRADEHTLTAAYERLARLAERELTLVRTGRIDELTAALLEAADLIAALPPTPPASARVALQRVRAVRERVQIELEQHRLALAHSRSAMRTAKIVRRTYSRPPRGRYSISA